MFHRSRLAIVAGITMSAFAASAATAGAPEFRAYSVTVNYSDLDLTKDADARQMLDRLDRASFKACGGNEQFDPAHRTRTGRFAQFFQECRDDALARAVATVDSQKLWQVFRAE